jgi:hypothetical protein
VRSDGAAHRDALAIEVIANLFCAETFQHEGDYASLFLCRADDAQPRNLLQSRGGVGQEHMFVARDIDNADTIKIMDGRAQANRVSYVSRAGLKSLRRRLIEHLLEGDILNHVAAALPWRHLIQHLGLTKNHANARRRKDLVPGKDIEIAIDGSHVHAHVRDSLRAIHQHAAP